MDNEERLQWVLAQVNDWLKFAEAKNGGVVLLNGAAVFGTLQVATSLESLPLWAEWYFTGLCAQLTAGALVALFSFLPRTEIPLLNPIGVPEPGDNLIFFGHARKYSPAAYLQAALARCPGGDKGDPRWLNDLAAQIVINSRIAVWKYSCFKLALWLTIAAVVTPVVAVVAFGMIWAWRSWTWRTQTKRASLATRV